MSLHGIDRRLGEGIAAEEVGVVAEECHAGGDLECPRTPSLGNPELGPEQPAIVAEIEEFAVVVLSKWCGDLQAHSDNEILPLAREILHRERGRSKQIDRDAKSRVAQARHLALARLAVHNSLRGERRRRHDHIELGRLAPDIEGPDIGQHLGIGMEIGVGDRQIRVERHLTFGVDVARNQKIKSDRRVRVRPWFGFLGFRLCHH